jgi:hypothetical protein
MRAMRDEKKKEQNKKQKGLARESPKMVFHRVVVVVAVVANRSSVTPGQMKRNRVKA